MRKLFVPVLAITALMFAYSPIAIAYAPYESTMRLVQKIFYYHFPAWMALTVSVTVCTVASAVYLFKGSPRADRIAVAAAEITVIFGLFGLVSGSLWGRKAWGVWWQWDARLTMAFLLELIFFGYILVRNYGGPGAEKLAAATSDFARDSALAEASSAAICSTGAGAAFPSARPMVTAGTGASAAWFLPASLAAVRGTSINCRAFQSGCRFCQTTKTTAKQAAARIMNTGVCGSVSSVFAMKESATSSQPPMNPAAAPITNPIRIASTAAIAATVRTSREPCTTCAKISTPE